MDGGTAKCSAQRLRYEPWSRRKDFWLRKNTSRQVRGEVCLDRADLVIDGMTRLCGRLGRVARSDENSDRAGSWRCRPELKLKAKAGSHPLKKRGFGMTRLGGR